MTILNTTPKHQTKFAAGADLIAAEDTIINPNQTVLVSTGYFFSEEVLSKLQKYNLVVNLHARSSLAWKKNLLLMNGVGVIDADYSDEIKVMYRNVGLEPVKLEKGERIAQLVPLTYVSNIFEVIENERNGGFGSSGRHLLLLK